MALTRLQIVCLTGHLVGFVVLLLSFASPFWTVLHYLDLNSTWYVISFGPACYLIHELRLDGNHTTEIKILEWDDFDGSLPDWVNIVRLLATAALIFQLITVFLNSVACARLGARHFFIQAITSFISVALSIATTVYFIFKIEEEKFDGESLNIYWSLYLFMFGATIICICAFLSLCAKEVTMDGESAPLVLSRTDCFVGQSQGGDGSLRHVYLLNQAVSMGSMDD